MRLWFGRRRRDAELDEEIRSHLGMAIRDRIERGESPEEAAHAARREFGNEGLVRETTREMWGWGWVENLVTDVRYGLRMLRKSPGFTLVAVVTLALGIGANTAIFSAVNGILLEPLSYAHSSRVVSTAGDLISLPEFRAVQKQSTAFEGMAFYGGGCYLVLGGGLPIRTCDASVSSEFFPLLGVRPLLGRYILPGDTHPGGAPVAVLSYQLWMEDFGGDPHIVGRKISLGQKQEPYTVVGVMPKGFNVGVTWLGPSVIDGLWMPWVYPPPTKEDLWIDEGPHNSFVARLKRGVTVAQANAQLKVISAQLAKEHPKTENSRVISVESVKGQMVGKVRAALLILLGAVGFVLLLACVNVASLLVARSWTRQRELTIRRALGATRLRMIRQLLAESVLLALAGGALGLLASVWGIPVLRAMAPPHTPRVDDIRIDSSVLWFAMGVSLLAAVLVGLLPAVQATSRRAGLALKGGLSGAFAGTGVKRTHRVRNALVVAEVLLGVVVVTGGALMGRSFYKLVTLDTGVHADHVITMHVEFPNSVCYGKDWRTKCPAANENMLDGVRSISGVERTALAEGGPLGGGGITQTLYVKGVQGARNRGWVMGEGVTPGYFSALGIRLLRGRYFDSNDMNSGRRVAIVSEGFAKKYIPGNPLGKEFAVSKDKKGRPQWMEIVGEVGSVRAPNLPLNRGVFAGAKQYYTPFSFFCHQPDIVARTAADPTVMVPAIERVVQSVNEEAWISQIRTVKQIFARANAETGFEAMLLGSFGALGLLLAIVGVYGVISYSVVQRTHEIGIRMALGAQRADVLGMILGEGMVLAVIGIVLGVGAALAVTRVLRSMLFEITPNDPTTFVGVAILLGLAALAACWIPARRAMRVDPMEALREE